MMRAPLSALRSEKGFTVAELITVCAIITILSAMAMPVARFGFRRQKELELKERLRKITDAIDYYHDLAVAGQIKVQESIGQNKYPKELDDLVKGVEKMDGTKMKLLRERDLTDPMTGQKEWDTRSTSDDPDATSSDGYNVYEVHSKSHSLALDGKTHYNEW
ncbi:MAG TPA: type II secretion system protein [Thermoanaerobaculia bacterium]|jgi:type II secretory pathway pseudopilin PulG